VTSPRRAVRPTPPPGKRFRASRLDASEQVALALDVPQPSLIDTLGDSIDAEAILGQHRAIMRAIDRRRPAEAEEAMCRHLGYLRGLVVALEAQEER
jgi:DNA-binding GntR family transcriptional regulator